ncbi:hypothetical protein B0H16DRAFT_1557149 [Mycena metata]|uniref:Secreted protein n=1 Tax=Mycena metata TaxID=1033252 RepID=A0AAD7IM60_9AGAR|nr:hypothetical protein B0H16DRAFT_1557149 [Mycena metata]
MFVHSWIAAFWCFVRGRLSIRAHINLLGRTFISRKAEDLDADLVHSVQRRNSTHTRLITSCVYRSVVAGNTPNKSALCSSN